jgi:PemK-like, MazF-like toxin of type II toxin-antitoxin system
MKFNQRDMVEIAFELPNGKKLIHPTLIISNEEVFNAEEIFYSVMLSTKTSNEEFVYELNPLDFNHQTNTISYAKCHLISSFREYEITKKGVSNTNPNIDFDQLVVVGANG